MATRVEYTPRWPFTTTDLEQSRDNPLSLGLYRSGSIVTPTSGTVRLYNSANVLVATETVVVASSFATVEIDADDLTSQSLGTGWRSEWSLLMPDTLTHVYRNPAALCRVLLPPAASCEDLLARRPDLDEYLPIDPATGVPQTSWQSQLDTVWSDLRAWIEGKGRRPFLITTSAALKRLHTFETLTLIGELLGGDGDESNAWVKFTDRYATKAKDERDSLTLEYDETDSGAASVDRRFSLQPTIMLCSRGGVR